MPKAAIPRDETKRLAALYSYEILDTAPEQVYDDLTLLASQICETPIAIISLVDKDRQWSKSSHGIEGGETDRNIAFCAQAILDSHQILEVENALLDDRFADNALVTEAPNIRFYAGCPLVDGEGNALGTLCVIDRKPKVLNDAQREALRALARNTIALLESRRNNHAMVKQNDYLALAERFARVGHWELNVKTETVFWSDEIYQIHGVDKNEYSPELNSAIDFYHPEDRPHVVSSIEKAVAEKSSFEFELRIIQPDGKTVNVMSKGECKLDEEGEVERIFGVFQDITSRVRDNERLFKNEERLNLALSGGGLGFWDWNMVTNDVAYSYHWAKMLGYEVEELSGDFSTWRRLILDEDRDVAEYKVAQYMEGLSDSYVNEFRMRHKDGGIRWILARGSIAKRDSNGKPLRMVGTHADITQRKNAAAELESSREFLRLMMDHNPAVIFVKDRTYKIVEANQAFFDMYPEEKQDRIIGYTTIEDYSPDEAELFLEQDRIAFEEGYSQTEETIVFPDGELRTLNTQKIRFLDAADEPFILGIADDITDRVKSADQRESLIEQLTSSNEELERFAYICSHDLQEPLRMIGSFSEKLAEHLQDAIKEDEQARKYIDYVTDGATRAQHLIADVLLYSSVEKEVRLNEAVDLNEIMTVIEDNLRTSIEEKDAKLLYKKLPTITGNKTQLYQLFFNLVSNGLKYQEPNVTPEVRVSCIETSTEYLFCVKDNGIGIDKKHLHKVFDVFQRLHRREKYQGTGVGLSICKKIVERHKGKIWIDSKLEEGSEFFVELPKDV